ncbi:hypothetical protein BT69DRAFT_244997 [Atractiella rhizophila]|nr:hypothetical protein BT69DRAFT_244997 [Atractiella rhizophila]
MVTHKYLREILESSLVSGNWGNEEDAAYDYEARRPGQRRRKRKGEELPSSTQASKKSRGSGSGMKTS